MDQYLLDNAQAYAKLVQAFVPKPAKTKPAADTAENPDIVIATRLRPMLEEETVAGLVTGVFPRSAATGVVDLHEMRKTVRWGPGLNSSSYTVDRTYGSDDSTETIYRDLVQPLVPWAWAGGVSTIFAYGQTGSGKTFTVSGLECLVTETLFSSDLDGDRQVFVSIIELAGNSAFDLLNARKPVSILEDSFGSTHLAGASEYHVTDPGTLLKHINNAASFRRTASTQKNDASSRSHAICKIRLENPALPQSDDGLLYLIDLAGSEAARDRTTHSAERMKEAREINASLSVLKDCVRGRANLEVTGAGPKKKAYVPFRQSALTKVLKHVFDPAAERSCKTVVVACVNPSFADVGASKNTLRYAEMLRVPVPKAAAPKYDASKPSTWSNSQLREWISTNSGSPEVSAQIVAPHETGKQLLRLPVPEFLMRCLKTPGVTQEQATAFQAKFWRLHVDSSGSGSTKPSTTSKSNTTASQVSAEEEHKGLSSHDARPDAANIPFKERIRPGMIVSWNPPDDTPGHYRLPGRNLVMVMAPERSSDQDQSGDGVTYRCSVVVPAVMPGAFEVYLWQQVLVPTSTIEAEVLLEYDVATRYYYETV
ncbi:P-loop containing nucleoside triphosphate hydrolase protein [Thelonectria olida]|uniref:P-loop containing nucleoside triphosphate hydrolase protein n=1 Tax=Thelonectria olida TaxID=1576542 RepID=A0A9P8W7F8_9HYPO|nr:P-loop containing nucleoside triphosphate hydrolase protein [Thelonectria olida]